MKTKLYWKQYNITQKKQKKIKILHKIKFSLGLKSPKNIRLTDVFIIRH